MPPPHQKATHCSSQNEEIVANQEEEQEKKQEKEETITKTAKSSDVLLENRIQLVTARERNVVIGTRLVHTCGLEGQQVIHAIKQYPQANG